MEERYLIIKPSSLGDVIHAFPAVTLLKKYRPDAKIDWVVAPAFADIVRLHPAVDQVILFRRKELGKIRTFFKAAMELFHSIRKFHYTAVIDLQGLLRSGIIARLAKNGTIVGPMKPKEKIARIFYRKPLDSGPASIHAVKRNIRLMAAFLGTDPEEIPDTEFLKDAAAAEKIQQFTDFLPAGKLIAVAPGARWPSKRWSVRYFQNTLTLLKQKLPECSFLILGTPDESGIAEELCKSLPGSVLNLTGKTTVTELLEAIRTADVLFCNDSGPMHIAAALGTPVTAMFAPTDPDRTGPFAKNAIVLTPEDLPCMKCFKYECENPLCHQAIPAEKAAQTLFEILTGENA